VSFRSPSPDSLRTDKGEGCNNVTVRGFDGQFPVIIRPCINLRADRPITPCYWFDVRTMAYTAAREVVCIFSTAAALNTIALITNDMRQLIFKILSGF
jgi:hypothetical protein